MEIKSVLLVHVVLLVLSEVIASPLASRSPLKDKKIRRPWRELSFHSEEDYGHDVSASSSDVNSIPFLSRKAIKYPDDTQDMDNHTADRNSFSSTSERVNSAARLDKFYRHRSPIRNREPEIIVFPKDDHEPIDGKDSTESIDDLKFGQRSDDVLFSNGSEETPPSPEEEALSTQIESLGHHIRQVLLNTEVPNVENSTTQQTSGNDELNVREQSLYTGPTLKTQENSGCPEGFKKTRNGSCQKPSRRLMQAG